MTARKARLGDEVLLRYVLRLENGVVIVSNLDDPEPEHISLGDGTLASCLENQVISMGEGERRCAHLPPEEAFGPADPALIRDVALADLPMDPALRADTLMEFSLPDGRTLPGHVLEVGETHARIDFNHPLAGRMLEFEVEVIRLLPS